MRTPAALWLLLALALSPVRASAAIVPPLPFDELVSRAEAIFVGRVVESHARWVDTPRGDVIATVVTFEVAETLKGSLSPFVQLEFLGGTIGNVTFRVPGVPTFETGEETLLFARLRGLHVSPIVGVAQGRFRIARHPVTGERYVTTADGLAFSDVEQLGGRIPTVSRVAVPTMRLETFTTEIARRVAGERRR